MKKIIFVLSTIIIIIILTWLFLFIYEKRSKQEQLFSTYSLTEKEIEKIKDGDIILRHGYGLVSDMIVKSLNDNLDISHCAIVSKNDTGIAVIHAVSQSLSDYDGVQSQDLPTFIRDSKENSVIVLRYKFKKNENTDRIAEKANYYLEERKPFDHSFNLGDTSEFYCTELIWRIFKDEYDIDLFRNRYGKSTQEHLKFDLFLDTTFFDVIINHHDSHQEDKSHLSKLN